MIAVVANGGSTDDGRPSKGRRFLFRIASVVFALILATVVAELALRIFTNALLGEERTAVFYDRYNTTPRGMYFHDPQAGMNFMWPSAEMTAHSHGYFWNHRTDARGFRNPPERQGTDVLLLGDSLIYGHGLDDDETVTSILHKDYGYSAYNMARQGDCLYQQYVLTRLFLDEFTPQTIMLFVFSNDLVDLGKTRDPGQIHLAPEIDLHNYAAIRGRIKQKGANKPRIPFYRRFIIPRLLVASGRSKKADAKGKGSAGKGRDKILALQRQGVLPPPGEVLDIEYARRVLSIPRFRRRITGNWRTLDAASLSVAEQYYRRILLDLKRRCDKRQTRLVVVNLALNQEGYWRKNSGRWGARFAKKSSVEISKEARDYVSDFVLDLRVRSVAQVGAMTAVVARDVQVEYLNLSEDFRAVDNYLPNDGHLSREGHSRLAERLNRLLSSNP